MTKNSIGDGPSQEIDLGRADTRFINHEDHPTPALLVCPELKKRSESDLIAGQARRDEFASLANAIHLDIKSVEAVSLREIKPATYIGGGVLENLADLAKAQDVELVLFDCGLSPVQQRNLENRLGMKVLDRTALILEIFGARAATREGVLQVELAHLNYQRSRLVRSWTHLERQRGGFGFIGGPGETQIEADRRQLRERISLLEKRLADVRRTRQLQRKPRDAVPFPLVALVGYTNAGKSTLFNLLTGAKVMAKDMLFATLDTTVRKATLPHGKEIIMSDTVGFIADLPTDLVAAFRATLEEVTSADIILHVRDISNPDSEKQAEDVMSVLADLGVNSGGTPILEVWNKIDSLDAELLAHHSTMSGAKSAHMTSATTGEGIDALLLAIEAELAASAHTFKILLPYVRGEDAAWLYRHTEVMGKTDIDEENAEFVVRVLPRVLSEFTQKFKGKIQHANQIEMPATP